MTKYQHHFCFVDETIALIEDHINGSVKFEKLKQYARDDEENEKIARLLEMIDEVGKIVETDYKESVDLFRYLKEDDECSIASLLSYAFCDFDQPSFEKQISSMQDHASNDPQNFIKVLLDWYDEDVPVSVDDHALFDTIDDLPFDDSQKWRIWHVCFNIDAYMKQLCLVIEKGMSVVEHYQDLFVYFEQKYEAEISKMYEGKDLYSYICIKLNASLEGSMVNVYPSIAKMLSISFINESSNQIIVRYGVGMIQRLLEIHTITQEKMFYGLKVLGDPSKFEILQALKDETLYGAQLAEILHLSTPTISYHMQSLINARFVTFEKQQNRLYYQLDKEYLRFFLNHIKENLNL